MNNNSHPYIDPFGPPPKPRASLPPRPAVIDAVVTPAAPAKPLHPAPPKKTVRHAKTAPTPAPSRPLVDDIKPPASTPDRLPKRKTPMRYRQYAARIQHSVFTTKNILFTLGFLLFGLVLFTNQALGEALLIIYGIAALVKKIPSRISFFMAAACLVCIPFLLAINSKTAMAGAFASYTFLLLVVGTATLAMELNKQPKHLSKPSLRRDTYNSN